ASIGLDLLVAHPAMQRVLVELLDTGLADVVRAAVIDRIELLELGLVDAPDIADRMCEMLTLRIVADQLCRDLNPWQPELIDRDTGNLLLRQFVHDRYRLEGATPLQHTF